LCDGYAMFACKLDMRAYEVVQSSLRRAEPLRGDDQRISRILRDDDDGGPPTATKAA
jgi:hypothetical protein